MCSKVKCGFGNIFEYFQNRHSRSSGLHTNNPLPVQYPHVYSKVKHEVNVALLVSRLIFCRFIFLRFAEKDHALAALKGLSVNYDVRIPTEKNNPR